jgi:hypothetical protein
MPVGFRHLQKNSCGAIDFSCGTYSREALITSEKRAIEPRKSFICNTRFVKNSINQRFLRKGA